MYRQDEKNHGREIREPFVTKEPFDKKVDCRAYAEIENKINKMETESTPIEKNIVEEIAKESNGAIESRIDGPIRKEADLYDVVYA